MSTNPEAAAKLAAEQARQNKKFDEKQWKTAAEREAAQAAYNRAKAEQNKRK